MNDPFLIATGNEGKFGEIISVLEDLPYTFLSLKDLEGVECQVQEDGETHDDNARIKARTFFESTRMMTLGEDSGLEVDALIGELGIHTRRWGAGPDATDDEWLAVFLDRMASVPEVERTARFVCSAVLILPNGEEYLFRGECRGVITREQEAPILPGLPLSSVFRPDGYDRVYAALSRAVKTKISHRGWAISQVARFLANA